MTGSLMNNELEVTWKEAVERECQEGNCPDVLADTELTDLQLRAV
jgi:hypothetical protein